jgi:hypothetical protein
LTVFKYRLHTKNNLKECRDVNDIKIALKAKEGERPQRAAIRHHTGRAQLARCILKGLFLQESTEIIQLINHLPTLFKLSNSLKGCDPRFSHQTTPFPLRICKPPTVRRIADWLVASNFHHLMRILAP